MKKIALILLCGFSFGFSVMFIKDGDSLIVVSCKSPSPKCEECISKCEYLENAKEKLDCVEECDVEIALMK